MAKKTVETPETGSVFGRLTVLHEFYTAAPRTRMLSCRCECGTVCELPIHRVLSGNTSSCGCLRSDILVSRSTSHGMSKTTTYKAWCHIKERCFNANCQDYPAYGGRGITVCDRWLSFENFFEDMGEKPRGKYSIDRLDTDGNYEPANCRWATDKQQARNKRNNHAIEFNGRTQLLVEWSQETGVKQETIRYRLKHGWSVEDALYKLGDGRNSK